MKGLVLSNTKGFTLVELMLTVSIMLILSAGVAVSYRGSTNTRFLNQNYYNLLNDLRTAQITALSSVHNPATPDADRLRYVGVKFYNDASGLGKYTTFRSNFVDNTDCTGMGEVQDRTYSLPGNASFLLGLYRGVPVIDLCVFFEMSSGDVTLVKKNLPFALISDCSNATTMLLFDNDCRVVFGVPSSGGTTLCRSLGFNSQGLISDGGNTCP